MHMESIHILREDHSARDPRVARSARESGAGRNSDGPYA